MGIVLQLGNSLDLLKALPENSIDCVVTDPPYGLTSITKRFGKEGSAPAQYGKDGSFARLSGGFMGKLWDGQGIEYSVEMWGQVFRVLKPGGHLLSFGGSRTYHRMASAIEDAGFEIRDQIMWVYGSGFPKSLNIGKAVDKLQGNERVEIGRTERGNAPSMLGKSDPNSPNYDGTTFGVGTTIHTKGTSEWEGWGTALKPAHEPIVLARKPLSEKTVAENVLKWGVGGLNIDGSRVETQDNLNGGMYSSGEHKWGHKRQEGKYQQPFGRFPANFIHDGSEEVVELFPNTKSTKSGYNWEESNNDNPTHITNNIKSGVHFGDSGSASRFFYCAKASKSERGTDNNHPTVKPLALMKYLIKLVSREGQTVLDPFMGSGTTGLAAKELNRNFVGMEMNAEYMEIAKRRVDEH